MAYAVITKAPHPLFPHLAYRYEGPEGLIGYTDTKSNAEKTLKKINQRHDSTAYPHQFKIGKGIVKSGDDVEAEV